MIVYIITDSCDYEGSSLAGVHVDRAKAINEFEEIVASGQWCDNLELDAWDAGNSEHVYELANAVKFRDPVIKWNREEICYYT